jgi:hypothetical protein
MSTKEKAGKSKKTEALSESGDAAASGGSKVKETAKNEGRKTKKEPTSDALVVLELKNLYEKMLLPG